MLSKSILSLATLALAQFALSQSSGDSMPYCLLAAINTFEHPADQQALCCPEKPKMQAALKKLCPSNMYQGASDKFDTACKDAKFGSCANSTSTASSGTASTTKSGKQSATSAPFPVTYTTTYYDTVCSCTKTKTVSTSSYAVGTGLATGTAASASATATKGSSGSGSSAGSPAAGSGSGSAATGSPIAPAPSGSKTGPNGAGFTGAASKNVASLAGGLMAVAAIAAAL